MGEEWRSVMAEIPIMDYERLSGFDIPPNVSITAIACSPVFCAIGTSVGGIQVIPVDGKMGRGFAAERFNSPVTGISIDASSDALCFIAGATGQICVVENLLSVTPTVTELPKVEWTHCPLKAVAMNPQYSSDLKRIVLGGASGDLLVISRDVPPLFAVSKTHSKGPITAVEWREDWLVWAGAEFGLKAINTRTSQRIVHLEIASKSVDLVFLGGNRFCFVTGFKLTVLEFREKHNYHTCEIVLAMELPAEQFAPNNELGRLMAGRERLAGLGIFDPTELSLTAVTVDGSRVSHHVIDTVKRDMPFSDLLPVTAPNGDVLTALSAGASPYMALACKDSVLRISRRSVSSNAIWMIDRGLFEEALEFSKLAEDAAVQEYVAGRAVAPLLAAHAYERAIRLAPKLRLTNQAQWSSFVDQFVSLPVGHALQKSLRALVPVLPYPPRDSVTLWPLDYEKVIESLLRNAEWSYLELLEAVRRWPVGVYNATPLKDALIDLVPETFALEKAASTAYLPSLTSVFPSGATGADPACMRNIALMLSLKTLYDQTDRLEDSLDILIRLGCVGEIVHLLNTQVVTNAAVRAWFEINMLSLFQADAQTVSQFVIKHTLLFPSVSVIAELESHPFFLHVYLRELFSRDPSQTTAHQPRQVDLFLQFDRERLVDFLRRADGYDPALALVSVRKARGRSAELVEAEALLMWRAGDRKSAVELLIDVSKDVRSAVKFAASVQDRELWEAILTRIQESDSALVAEYMEALLDSESVPEFSSPENLLLTIKPAAMTPKLLSVATKVLLRQKLKADIEKACQTVVASDWEKNRACTRPWDRGVIFSGDASACRVCGCTAICPPPGGDCLDTHALPDSVVAGIPLHARTRAVLSVVREGQLVHSRCLTRTVIESSAFSS